MADPTGEHYAFEKRVAKGGWHSPRPNSRR